MKVLIIGASGMLAKPVVRELDKRGFELRLFSRNVNADMFFKDFEICNGDVYDSADLEKAVHGCDAIHISLSNLDEALATEKIVQIALKENIKLISMISGCTVAEENRWFPMMDNKYRAEQSLIKSGIPFMIFRATWFFESLELMIQKGKASVIGKQNNPWHWIAAQDYAHMVGEAYQKPEARNKIFYVLGNKPYLMKDLLKLYCEAVHPEIKKVSEVPPGVLKFIGVISRNNMLKQVADMFRYFEKTKEMGDPEETYSLLGKPGISFEKWLEIRD